MALILYKMLFDHHIHSKYSVLDSRSEIADIIAAAKGYGLGAIAISDHDAIEGSLAASKLSSPSLLIIQSAEISSADGHIIGLGIAKLVEAGLSAEETIKRIHKLGGVAIAAHPYDRFRSGVGDLCWKLPFDAIEINGHCLYGNGAAESAAKRCKKPLVGGSDSHSLGGIGSVCTEVAGKSAKDILKNIVAGETKVVSRHNKLSFKASILSDKVSRKIRGV